MYLAIVLLPLAGAIIAGLISLFGAHKAVREHDAVHGVPGGGHGHDGHGDDASHRRNTHAHDAHDDHGAHGGHGHGDDDEIQSPGARPAQLVTSAFLVLSAILSWIVFFQVTGGDFGLEQVTVLTWIHSGDLVADWSLRIDSLTAVMLIVVTTVSALVHVYSIGYMSHDAHTPRFFAYLSLFTFAMLTLVTADNLVQLFFGWEGVGLASYLLIGFWYKKPSANAAAIKAFVVNRVGDFGFALGIFALFFLFDSVDLTTIFSGTEEMAGHTIQFLGMELDAMNTIAFLLFIGAMGKSAQFLLHTWLPDAMEGPTPVSALIHAATMVTAGVFLVARMSPVFEQAPDAMMFVALVGAITAFFAATVGLVQNDIKRVIAYSTCSQLGYMFVALGLGAYQVAIFHLFTHAFFKALLFLGAGSVIHAVGGEQDMRQMGGLRKKIPLTYAMMLIGTLALTGFPLTAGYFSKDAIVEVAAAGVGQIAGLALVLTITAAIFTSFYSWRLIFMTFHGKFRGPQQVLDHAHESPPVMTIPLGILAAGALFAGIIWAGPMIDNQMFGSGTATAQVTATDAVTREAAAPADASIAAAAASHGEVAAGDGDHGASPLAPRVEAFWQDAIYVSPDNHILHDMHDVPAWVPWAPTAAMIVGLLFAIWFYLLRPEIPRTLAREQDVLYRFLLNKWYFDEIYDFLFVRPINRLARFLWKRGDGWLIDGFGPDGVSARVADITRSVVRLQSGYIYHYAFAMLIGAAVLITWMMFGG
ncbi:MAG: NADH-quinone oxidoreductase subunit L [Bauldia sp.]|nr:NADH-quinone oxidoreductase subunit L [Bauldia sp.]